MDPVVVAKVAKMAADTLKSKEKRERILMFFITVVVVIFMMLSVTVYIVTNPIDAVFKADETESNVTIRSYGKIEDTVWNYLKDIGFNAYGAAGVMGNIMVESSFRTEANHNNIYFGLCQWGGGRWSGNAISLSSYSLLKGTHWTDLQTQLSFLEMECRMSYSNVYEQMQNATSIDFACDYFCTYYEGCTGKLGNWAYSMVNGKAYQCLADRRKYAEFYYHHYSL